MDFITLSGHADPIPLTEDAKSQLLGYLNNARASVENTIDGDDLIRDLETSIGDTMRAGLTNGANHIDGPTMSKILGDAGPLDSAQPVQPVRTTDLPWICRVQQGKWFGGLCLGLAIRRGFRVDWVRTIAIFFLLITGGLLGVAYLIALIFVPSMETPEAYRTALGQAQQRPPSH